MTAPHSSGAASSDAHRASSATPDGQGSTGPGSTGPGPAGPGSAGTRPADGAPPASPFAGLGGSFDRALARGLGHVTRRALGSYQTAIVRIGFAGTVLFFLLREFPHRHELYGPDSAWGWDLAERMVQDNGAFTVLLWTDSTLWFETVYVLTLAASVGLLLGWRTRTMTVLFMVGVLSLQNRSILVGDGGDNVIRLMAIYLVLVRCAQVWSLDARRLRRSARGLTRPSDPVGVVLWAMSGVTLAVTTGGGLFGGWGWQVVLWGLWLVLGLWWVLERHWPGEPRLVCDVVANLVHNAGLFVIMAQVCVIYATAGWYKIQGSRWQDGTAVYYPLNLDYFTPFPGVSEWLATSGALVMLLSYATVMIQVAFPFALLNRKVKNVFLAIMIAEHVGIAVLMGLPFFSLAMIAMDVVFLPTVFLVWLGYRTRRAVAPLGRLPGTAGRRRPEEDTGGAPSEAVPGKVPPAEPRGTTGAVPTHRAPTAAPVPVGTTPSTPTTPSAPTTRATGLARLARHTSPGAGTASPGAPGHQAGDDTGRAEPTEASEATDGAGPTEATDSGEPTETSDGARPTEASEASDGGKATAFGGLPAARKGGDGAQPGTAPSSDRTDEGAP